MSTRHVDIRTQVRMFAEGEDFNADGINYMDCPQCGKYNKLMVVLDENGGAFYKCFSDSCDVRGRTNGGVQTQGRVPTLHPKRKTYPPADVSVLRPNMKFWYNNFRLDRDQVARLCPGTLEGAYVFPIKTRLGSVVGYLQRRFGADAARYGKAYIRPYFTEGSLLAWYPHEDTGKRVPLVLVEDQISAVRLSKYVSAVALLGTGLTTESRHDILVGSSSGTLVSEVIVSLDDDATATGANIARNLGVMRPTRHMPLTGDVDIKDMTEAQFFTYLERLGVCP
jgi:hypothetical protein